MSIPGTTESYEYKEFFDLRQVEGFPSKLAKRLTITVQNLRYYLTFETEKEMLECDDILRFRIQQRKIGNNENTKGPIITSPTRTKDQSGPFSSFKRALTRTSLRRKKSSTLSTPKTSSASGNTAIVQPRSQSITSGNGGNNNNNNRVSSS